MVKKPEVQFWHIIGGLSALIFSLATAEFHQYTNLVNISLPLSTMATISAVSTTASAVLTTSLVYLYNQQRKIQKNQEELMENQYGCTIVGYLSSDGGRPTIEVKNIGPGAAYDVSIECDLGYKKVSVDEPLLEAGQETYQRVSHPSGPLEEDSRYKSYPNRRIGLEDRMEYFLNAIEDGRLNGEPVIKISYKTTVHRPQSSSWEIGLQEYVEERKKEAVEPKYS